jgi:DNA-binding PadR family transcriptional regulator
MPGRRLQPGIPPRLPKDLRTAWLLLLLRAEPSYGYELRRKLGARGLEIEPGTLYRSLRELERDGLITSRWMDPAAGPRARVYTITPNGERNLAVLAAAIETARDTHAEFLAAYAQAVHGRKPAGPAPWRRAR